VFNRLSFFASITLCTFSKVSISTIASFGLNSYMKSFCFIALKDNIIGIINFSEFFTN